MKKIIFILFFLQLPLWAQVHHWVQIHNTIPTSSFLSISDSVYYTNNLYRMYKGYTGTTAFIINSNLVGTEVFYAGYETGTSFIHDNKYYNLAANDNYNNYFYSYITFFSSYNLDSTIHPLSLVPNALNGWYTNISNFLDEGAIIGDSLFYINWNGSIKGSFSSHPSHYNLLRYSFTSNSWTYNSTQDFMFGYYNYDATSSLPLPAGLFTIGDTLYSIVGWYNLSNRQDIINGARDTVAQIWKRNSTTYQWSKIKEFLGAGILLGGQKINNNQYFLLESTDSTNANAGLWKFDGNTFTQIPKPPSNCRIIGSYVVNDTVFWESVSSTGISDSNKIFFHSASGWDTGQRIYYSGSSKYIMPSNIAYTPNTNTLFVGYKNGIGLLGTGETSTAAYDTNYYYASIAYPNGGELFNTGDSINVKITKNFNDTIKVYISYANGVYNSVGYVTTSDSIYVRLDTTSAIASIRITDLKYNINVTSNQFKVYPAKYIQIDTVYYSPSNVSIKNTNRGLSQLKAYYSVDSLTWQYLGTSTIAIADTPATDTLSYPRLVGMNTANAYYKLVEVIDTAVYGYQMSRITSFGLIKNPQICLTSKFSDANGTGYPGCKYIVDVGCGWVGGITYRYGVTTTIVNTDGTVVPTYTETSTKTPPVLISNDLFQGITASNPLVYAGREYWIVTTPTNWYPSYDLWMRDLVNNVSYPVMHVGGGGYGIVASWSSPEAKVYSNYIAVFRSDIGLDNFSTKLLPYPNSGSPLFGTYHLIANAYNYSNRYQILQPRF